MWLLFPSGSSQETDGTLERFNWREVNEGSTSEVWAGMKETAGEGKYLGKNWAKLLAPLSLQGQRERPFDWSP